MSGGFIGVDIFFAISGFLITTIIIREITDHRFSIAEFYRRRVARIFPALFAMLAATLAAGLMWMLPKELSALGQSAIAATIFGANIFFWRTADYFDSAAESKPLLHTWSLGVEEQFYMFFPVIVLIAIRFAPKHMKSIIFALTLGSLLLGAALTIRLPQAAFYLLPTRAWELGLGAMVATGCFPMLASGRVRDVAATAGLVMIVIGLFLITPEALFPVPWAILPCLGAALIIAYGRDSTVGRLLSLAPLRWVGLISYSLYLWHWPIITFYRLQTGFDLDLSETLMLVLASFAAGSLSYYLIERPTLARLRTRGSAWPILVGGGGAMAALVAGCVLISAHSDAFQTMSPAAARVAAFSDYRSLPEYKQQFRRGPCFRGAGDPFRPDLCLKDQPGKRNIIVIGDSHAAQYWRAFALRYPDANVMQATASGCRPTLRADGERRCTQVIDYVFDTMVPAGKIDSMVIGGRWREADIPKLLDTVRYLKKQGIAVMLIGPTVEYQSEFPASLARAIIQGNADNVHSLRTPGPTELDRKMASIFQQEAIVYVSVHDLECPKQRCHLLAPDNGPMQFDYGHLTLSASRWVVDQMPAI